MVKSKGKKNFNKKAKKIKKIRIKLKKINTS